MKHNARTQSLLATALIVIGAAHNALARDDAAFGKASKQSPTILAREITKRGEESRRKWKLAEAESDFQEAARIDPTNIEATLGLARIARMKFDYAGAIRFLDRAARYNSESADLMAEYGQVYLAAEELSQAAAYFESALKRDSSCGQAIIGMAGITLLRRDYESAESRLREWLSRNPASGRAHAMLARVFLERNQSAQAAAEAEKALALDPFDTDALYTLAFVRATQRKPAEVRALAKRALTLDPLNVGARRLLSQYLDGRAGYEQKVPDAAHKSFALGSALKREGRLAEATPLFEAALRAEPKYYRALIALGDIWLREGDHDRAATAARLAIEVDPEGSLAHLELSYALLGIQERARIAIGATDFAELFYKRPAPPSFALTGVVFPNYKFLSPRHKMVIDSSIAPLAQFLPKLARGGARHYLLPYDQRVSDSDDFDDIDGNKTFDGRYYASVRGVGGRITVSGTEYIEMAARGGFNTIAHEFAHQVHMIAMGKDDVRAIRRMYERAMREGRALDYYAAVNEFEYFAQGYEAFISERKRPAVGVTARHTNQELLARDPELHKFLTKLMLQSRALVAGAAFPPMRVCLTKIYLRATIKMELFL